MTLSEWLAAQGHWTYVIASYAVALIAILIEVWHLRARHARALAQAARPTDHDAAHDDVHDGGGGWSGEASS